jgi:hypothetical protein
VFANDWRIGHDARVSDSERVHVFEHSKGDWWAECLICREWVSASNDTQRDAEQKFGRHLQNDHPASTEPATP